MNTATLWEEKNLIEQSRKSESRPIFAQNDGINEINGVSVKNECENIGNKKIWRKLCPQCNGEMSFHSKHGYISGIKRNTKCSVCKSRKEINHIGERFGKLIITNQYYIKGKTNLKVDYICDCGNETKNKVFGKVKTQTMCMKCRLMNAHKKLEPGEASFNSVYISYLRNAKKRNLVFELSREQVRTLTKQKCVYCGELPSVISRPKATTGGYVYNGIDRMDNNNGYVFENCVPCCKICNFLKYKLTKDDFLDHIKKIYEHQFVKEKR